LEIGAFDGVYHSNTLCLERDFGWTGWLVESDPAHAAAAARVRRAKVLNYTISPASQREQFFVARQWGGLVNYTRSNLLTNHIIHNSPIITRPTIDLFNVLRSEALPPVIDYLSIDVEGAEYPILKSYFAHKPPIQFRCMTIEVGIYADDVPKLCELLDPLGYRLENVRAWDAYFIHRELCSA
jgi:hypothetical protein